ncbi:transposase [Streptomyces gardneri]|uniref:transposase n=1 Tax=Nocardia sputi TaxID=2943705 RepID=UPI00189300B8|nr:transposase [Nocardia sputi]MBF6169402.1 transposase [Streptomyces gardneri]MBF6209253.1 transposase [Streptomyces gardneri]
MVLLVRMFAVPPRKRRSYTTEYKVEAAHRVIDTGRTIADVARELGIDAGMLSTWVRDERRRVEAATGQGEEPLSAPERAELQALRKRVAEQDKDIAFLKKASAYFAAMQNNRPGSI